MALKKKGKASKTVKKPEPVKSEKKVDPKKGKKVVMIFLPPKLHARVKLGCMALSTTLSAVIRELLEEWTKKKAKSIASVINMEDFSEESEDEEAVEVDTDEEEEEEEETEEEEEEEETEEEEDDE